MNFELNFKIDDFRGASESGQGGCLLRIVVQEVED